MKILILIVFVSFVPLLLVISAFALMPPHIAGEADINTKTGTVAFHGYSLGHTSGNDIKVIDLNLNRSVPFEKKVACKPINNCTCFLSVKPGCWQQKCTVLIKIKNPVKSHAYIIKLLDNRINFTVE
jgi:hypothetical protein